jgi:hypothetical protein
MPSKIVDIGVAFALADSYCNSDMIGLQQKEQSMTKQAQNVVADALAVSFDHKIHMISVDNRCQQHFHGSFRQLAAYCKHYRH